MNRRGVALVLVLWIVVILGALGTRVVGASRATTGVAANRRAAVVARYAAESGVAATVAEVEAALGTLTDSTGRADWLNALVTNPRDSVQLGDARFAVTLVDPSARLDVNAAPVDRLASLLANFTDIGRATETASRIREAIERAPGDPGDGRMVAPTGEATRFVTPLRSLDGVRNLPGVDRNALAAAAPYLTIDGDGTVNRRTASDTVLRAAFGEIRDEPSRLLVVSRGWDRGSPLSHEVQAVYAISGTTLVLVHWREVVR